MLISQVLNMDFLLAAAEDTRSNLDDSLVERRRRTSIDQGPLTHISTHDIRDVVDELARAHRASAATASVKASEMWMPRDPILAILQTELTRALHAQTGSLITDTEGLASLRIAADPGTRDAERRRAFGKFEVTRPKIFSDPRWVWAGVVIAWHRFKNKAPFGGLPQQAVRIADDARVVLLGDWGSGLPRAQAVAKRIRDVLDEGVADKREQHVVHLGDVYYTGAKEEYTDNFLAYWPVRPGEPIGSYTICGNHDMYRGGHDFYATALTDPRFDRQADRSVFALKNSNWQFLGLDTAYEDHQLSNGQVEWVHEQLSAAANLNTVLLSHHQGWSAYEDAGAQLRAQLADVLATERVDAWFWGHEHRCLTYDAQHGVGFASCLGHGGVPEYLIAQDPLPYPVGLRYDYRLKHGTGLEPWNTFGFAVIELNARDMVVRYIDERGVEHHREHLQR
ncbi:hypothetical protein A5753_13515 [Mycobacterium sp. 852002-51971_SCH5477799-a]|uniref:metallophosphoesterase family protein n=1 Tax=Mycobacterium sp. 852002-51971_SCH5477799-a TaxID=1834106 RepID=UPI0008018C6F|nr:metallophosphoesterase [Mycobacterium sp. 852002-51971_SCH5477799-a]OBF63042.1 hypothetical protein A5753_13515 [Mycobacterium sp. 852002-51971_SCH5477799-a]